MIDVMDTKNFFKEVHLAPDEKFACKGIVKELINLARIIYNGDVNAFEEQAAQSESKLLKIMAKLIAYGCAPEVVDEVMTRIINSEGYKGRELFEALLIVEGMTLIQNSVNPDLIGLKLSSLLGLDYFYHEFDNCLLKPGIINH